MSEDVVAISIDTSPGSPPLLGLKRKKSSNSHSSVQDSSVVKQGKFHHSEYLSFRRRLEIVEEARSHSRNATTTAKLYGLKPGTVRLWFRQHISGELQSKCASSRSNAKSTKKSTYPLVEEYIVNYLLMKTKLRG